MSTHKLSGGARRFFRITQLPRCLLKGPGNSVQLHPFHHFKQPPQPNKKTTIKMSDAYERERQNNSRLSELSAKVTALRGVTVDIYDNARAQDVIDDTVRPLTSVSYKRDLKLMNCSQIPSPPCPHPSRAPLVD